MANSEYLRDMIVQRTLLSDDMLPEGAWVSLHIADPGVDGASELGGGEYVRQRAALVRTAIGVVSNSNDMKFPRLPATVVTHLGLWDAPDGGRFLAGAPVLEPQRTLDNQSLTLDSTYLVMRFL